MRRPLTGASPDQVSVPNYYFFAGFGIEASDNVHICGSPMYHTAVGNFVAISLNLGQTVVLMDKWSPEEMLRLIDAHGVTQSHMVPTQFSRLLELPEDVRDYTQGSNNFDRNGYGGPMPPPDHGTHHYFFWLLALDAQPDLPPGLTLWELLEKIEPNVIGMNRLVGTYARKA